MSATTSRPLNPVVQRVTQALRDRSAALRGPYLERVAAQGRKPRGTARLGCANVAHAVAGLPEKTKFTILAETAPNLAIVSAYNEMLSAHAPLGDYPAIIKSEAARLGVTAQFAGGVPAMCDGVTQGAPGMELSLFSRDVIAQATAIALSHDVFDVALLLGVCDKIVPGLLIGALHFGHLPAVFVPAGPMPSGLSNSDKAKLREQASQGLVDRKTLLQAECSAYHAPGTCTFYGTANSNQMLMEAMGLHVPGSAFVQPGTPLREALTREAVRAAAQLARAKSAPIGVLVDERCIVNAVVALLATGGSTNHLMHWVAVARAAGMVLTWDDFEALSQVSPLLCRIYPNGQADVNDFAAAGGTAFVLRELLDAGLLHGDVLSVAGDYRRYTAQPVLSDQLHWQPAPAQSGDAAVLRPAAQPFSPSGGVRLLQGNLGRAVIKVSAVPDDRHVVEAPARVFDSQAELLAALQARAITQDTVVVVRFQGPQANGMPELHKLTPGLAVLQSQGLRVALVTDGRMSGASGKVPAAIHVCPEAMNGGPLAKVRDGDMLRVDAVAGRLDALVPEPEWAARAPAAISAAALADNAHGLGRELFAGMRRLAARADEGAVTWL